MRTAFPLMDLLTSTGGIYNSSSRTLPFPDPEVIPDVEKNYTMWLEQLPAAVRDYCQWWYQNASLGPPVLHDLIDSVLSIPEGGSKKPPISYIDYNHCPGEGCQYGLWNTTEDISVFDKPQSTKKIGIVSAGESFTAISGNIYLIPKEEIVAEEIEVYDSTGSIILEPGRKYYILSYISEGHSNVWVNGRIMICSDSPYNESQQWWVKINTAKGKEGWILYPENGSISGNDYLE